jgi:hypothetical protein
MRELLACSIVPQPTTLPQWNFYEIFYSVRISYEYERARHPNRKKPRNTGVLIWITGWAVSQKVKVVGGYLDVLIRTIEGTRGSNKWKPKEHGSIMDYTTGGNAGKWADVRVQFDLFRTIYEYFWSLKMVHRKNKIYTAGLIILFHIFYTDFSAVASSPM